MSISTRLTELLRIKHPILLAPMDVVADGHVVFALTSLNPIEHVQSTLAFVRKWRDERKK